MTKVQIEKVRALAKCRLADFQGERTFTNGMAWLAQHAPGTALSHGQRWYLDALLWRYRKQLAGRENGYSLPTAAPREEDYYPPGREPAQKALL